MAEEGRLAPKLAAQAATSPVPTVLTTGAGNVVVDLGSDAEDAKTREEPEEAPAPSSSAADTTVAAPTIATEAELDDASRDAQAVDTDPAVTQQEVPPAGGMATPPPPQPMGASVEESAAGEQQDAPPQVDNAPPGQTVVAGASSSSAASFGPTFGILVRERHELVKGQLGEVRQAIERERQELSRLREEARLAWQARDEATAPVVPEAEFHRQLEAQRAEHRRALDSRVAAHAKAGKEHEEVLATAQARLNEKSELLGALDVWIAQFFDEEIATCARDITGTILPRVHLRHPDLPFKTLLDAWSDSEDGPTHCQAVSRFVDEVVDWMQRKPEPEPEPEPPAEDTDN
ncbi:uncharacterized protein LOC104582291 [Brachypodium distachyon]|uniref:uncharacterized protein LOC104582291 n=1 Tax=Brachypodium distachyon TaxID=15368 RepID=UPI00053005EE|nr:uncharacterized protein LOC104582291 [Brachypodium distachyon]|eukprot:XP_010230042.1 uncharacterized protein LOC104582291 [Brachypodium distachyon]